MYDYHCVKSVQIRSFFWSVFSRIQSECGKIRTRKNSVFGHAVYDSRNVSKSRSFFVFDYIPDKCKTQEICNLAVSLYPSFIVYCPYKYITQEMCDEAVDDSLTALLFPIGFLQVK